MHDKISEVFDINPVKFGELPPLVVDSGSKEVTDDASEARANLKRLRDTATRALEHSLDVAIQSDSPRAYEVLATLLSAAAGLNTQIMDVHTSERKMSGKAQQEQTPVTNVTNNVVFTGTSAEMNDLIAKRIKAASE